MRGVYIIHARNQGKIKIGRSKKIPKRVSDLKTGFMDEGELVLIIRTNKERELEKYFHDKLQSTRDGKSEWFFITHDSLKEIYSLDSLPTKFEINSIERLEGFKNIFRKIALSDNETTIFKRKIDKYFGRIPVNVIIPALTAITLAIYACQTVSRNKFVIFIVFLILGFIVPFFAMIYGGKRHAIFITCAYTVVILLWALQIINANIYTSELTEKILETGRSVLVYVFLPLSKLMFLQLLFKALKQKSESK